MAVDLKHIATGGAPDEGTEPIKAFNEALGRLLGEETGAQEPDFLLDEDEAVLIPTEASIEVARPVHISGLAGVSRRGELKAALVPKLHDRTAERRTDSFKGS